MRSTLLAFLLPLLPSVRQHRSSPHLHEVHAEEPQLLALVAHAHLDVGDLVLERADRGLALHERALELPVALQLGDELLVMCRELRCKALRLLLLRDQPRLVCLRLVSKHKLRQKGIRESKRVVGLSEWSRVCWGRGER
eukprot:364363-Chlamydomonas_euryale.AAC.1